MPALAGQHFPTSPAQRQQAADAKAGAGTDDQPGAIRLGAAGPDLHQLVRAQPRGGPGHGAEVVDQQQVIQPQLLAERGAIDHPVVVGETEIRRPNRTGAGQADRVDVRHRFADPRQVVAHGQFRPWVVGAGEHLDGFQALPAPERETRISAADIADQAEAAGASLVVVIHRR